MVKTGEDGKMKGRVEKIWRNETADGGKMYVMRDGFVCRKD